MTWDPAGLDRKHWIHCLDVACERNQQQLVQRLVTIIRRL
jgi:hypothetical protein